MSIVICTAFILAWSPYAVVSAWSAWGFHVPNLTSIFTRLFAKSASFYNPLIYFGLSSKFRKDAAVLLPCTRHAKDTVRLRRFRARADGHAQGGGAGGGARLKVPRHRTERRPPWNRLQQNLSPDSEPQSPAGPPLPPVGREVFYIDVPRPSDSGPDYLCERL